jgi:S-adenosylmethionine:tRNA ribosyltransferase-isomerase
MKTSDFSFDVPEELIAQEPVQKRGTSRLMIIERATGSIEDTSIKSLPFRIGKGALVVLNDTKVNKARLFGQAERTGGRVEFLLLSRHEPNLWLVLASKSKRQREGKRFQFPGEVSGTIKGQEGQFKLLKFDRPIGDDYLDEYGTVPLPPYIKRPPTRLDEDRYQTVYARYSGSTAAPTAGLHFTDSLIKQIERHGAHVAYITLHVGTDTFLPIRTERVEEHKMHEETFHISDETALHLEDAIRDRRDVLAIGTTVVRALEASYVHGMIRRGLRKTSLFIYPGYRFRVVNRLFTNLHTPRSSLFLLVSAFAGIGLTKTAYQAAIDRKYRFFSYGDAMLII